MSHIDRQADAIGVDAARIYMDTIKALVRAIHPGAHSWPEDTFRAACITTGVQFFLRPETFGLSQMNLDSALYATACGMGMQASPIADGEPLAAAMRLIVEGFSLGRARTIAAIVDMQTEGSA